MLGLYLVTLIIGQKLQYVQYTKKTFWQKELQNVVTNYVFWTKK